jgi:hypothetical protein
MEGHPRPTTLPPKKDRTTVRDFLCPRCGQRLTFENSLCLHCGGRLAFDPDARAFVLHDELDRDACSNRLLAGCNWLAVGTAGRCLSCALTRTRPADTDVEGMPAFAEAEAAKRRLVLELIELGLPITSRDVDPARGLAFDLLSSAHAPVITGHADGVITLDLAESDDVHREQLRVSMDEPYRTLLGHFRHEVGHYYAQVLTERGPARERFEELFGDPDADYQDALDRHYAEGAPAGWEDRFISSYATMHPAEDWAETFAHYLHIRDTIDTSAAFGFAPAGATLDQPLPGEVGFERLISLWLPLSWSLNMINRSMGHSDLYPFVLPPPVLEKMLLVHELVQAASA